MGGEGMKVVTPVLVHGVKAGEGMKKTGHEAKGKHVTQDPLKRNLAQQKKELHIIIKSSWRSKNRKYYSYNHQKPPPRPIHTHTRTPAHSTTHFSFRWQRRRDDCGSSVFPQEMTKRCWAVSEFVRVCMFICQLIMSFFHFVHVFIQASQTFISTIDLSI